MAEELKRLFALNCPTCGATVNISGHAMMKLGEFRCSHCQNLLAPNHEAEKQAKILEEMARRRDAELARLKAEEEARRKAEEWECGAPARARQEALEAFVMGLGWVYFLYLAPALLWWSWAMTLPGLEIVSFPYKSGLAWAPGFNILCLVVAPFSLLGGLIDGGIGTLFTMLLYLILWAVVVPLVVHFATGQTSKVL